MQEGLPAVPLPKTRRMNAVATSGRVTECTGQSWRCRGESHGSLASNMQSYCERETACTALRPGTRTDLDDEERKALKKLNRGQSSARVTVEVLCKRKAEYPALRG